MTQPATAEAIAIPGPPMDGKTASAMPRLTATDTAAKYIGVRVSSRAKYPGVNALISTKAGRPSAKIARIEATVCVLPSAANCPRS